MEQSDFMSVSRRGGEILGRLEDDMRQNVERSRPECDRLWTPAMPPQFRWLVLTEDLPAASLGVPATATARPADFDPMANSGYGGYTIDTETTLMVIEATGQRRYGEGAWVLCRPQGTVNSGAWEPVAAGVGLGSATLAATLAYNDAVASVTLLAPRPPSMPPISFAKRAAAERSASSARTLPPPRPANAPWILLRLVPTRCRAHQRGRVR